MEGKSFFQALEKRRSVRSFDNTEVEDKAIIKKIIEVCDLSPSAGGLSLEIYYVDNIGVKK